MSTPDDRRVQGGAEPPQGAEHAWSDAAPLWPALLGSRGQALAVKDAASGRYRAVGPGWRELFGLEPVDCVGRTDVDLFGGSVATAWRAADQMSLGRPDAVASDHAFEWRGQWRELSVTRQAVQLAGAQSPQILSHWVDVRAQRQQARQLAEALAALQQAREAADAVRRNSLPLDELRDPVSGLPGPAPFLEQLRREFDLSAREGREMSLVLLEVDIGEAAGELAHEVRADEVAAEVGNWMRTGTRTMDALARLGPRRYAILLSGAGLSIAARRAEALRSARRPLVSVAAGAVAAGADAAAAELPLQVPLAVSMGVASYPLSANAPDALVQAAEQALQRAQARGGNQLALAGLSLQEQAQG